MDSAGTRNLVTGQVIIGEVSLLLGQTESSGAEFLR
jgi:hypothetical protein